MNIKVIGLVGAMALLTPMAAEATPAGGLTAHTYSNIAAAPQTSAPAAVVPGDPAAKVEKVWWRGGWRGGGWRYGWRGGRFGWGGRRFWGGYYGFYRPYWRRRFYY